MEENEEIFEEQEDGFFEHHRIISDKGQKITRIDKFLVDRLERTSRSRIQNACDSGFILVNGTAVKSNYKVKPNDIITVELPYPVRETELVAENIPIEIIYEDDDLVILMKPSNMVVHPASEISQAPCSMPCCITFRTYPRIATLDRDWFIA